MHRLLSGGGCTLVALATSDVRFNFHRQNNQPQLSSIISLFFFNKEGCFGLSSAKQTLNILRLTIPHVLRWKQQNAKACANENEGKSLT